MATCESGALKRNQDESAVDAVMIEQDDTVAPVGNMIVISFYNKVAQDWKQDGSTIQMRLRDPHSAVTSQQQLDRVTGTVQRMMEVVLEPTEMWLALCKLNIECYASSYDPSYIAQALQRLVIQPILSRR